jgi:TP901 family phage tail tape measure protein
MYKKGMKETVDYTDIATKAMKIGFVALSAAVIGGTVAFAKFEQGLSNISTIIDNSRESVKAIGDDILKLGKDIPKPISELVESMYDIRSAGISAANATNTLASAGRLATVGLSTTKQATDILTTSINSFASEGRTANEISNILFKTVQYGKNTIAELSHAFGQTAPLAKAAGLSLTEFSAATASLTAQGIPASVAQHQIRAAMVSLEKQTAEMKTVFRKLGYKDMKELMTNSENLGDAFSKIKDAADELDIPLSQVTGRVEGANAITVLATEGAELYNKALKDMESGVDSVDAAFQRQSQTLMAQKQLMQNLVNTIAINFGEKLQPALISAGKGVSETLNMINKLITDNGAAITSAFKLVVSISSDVFNIIGDTVMVVADLFNLFGGYQIIIAVGVALKVVSAILSAITSVIKVTVKAVNDMFNDFGALGTVLKIVFATIAAFMAKAYLIAMLGVMHKLIVVTKAWKIATAALNLVMKMNPIGLMITAAIALGALIYDLIVNFNEWKLSFSKLINNIIIGWKQAKALFAGEETKAALEGEIESLRKQNTEIENQTEALKKRKEELKSQGMGSMDADRQASEEVKAEAKAAEPAADNTKAGEDIKTAAVAKGEQDRYNIRMNAGIDQAMAQDAQNASDLAQLESWYETKAAAEEERYLAEQAKLATRKETETMTDEEYRIAKEELEAQHYARLQTSEEMYWANKNKMTKKQDTFLYGARKKANEQLVALNDGMYTEFMDTLGEYAAYSKEAAIAYKAISIGQAVVSTYLAASKALSTMPFPSNIGAAALVTAKGLITVAKIKAQSFAVGTDMIQKDMIANVHQGEGIIPKKENQFLQSGKLALVSPDAVANDGSSSGQTTINETNVIMDGANFIGSFPEDKAIEIANTIAIATNEKRFAGFPSGR